MGKIVIIFVIIGLGLGAFYVYGNITTRDIKIELKAPDKEIKYGEAFDVEILFENNSNNNLNDVRFLINLPEHIISAENGNNANISRDLGDIEIGGVHREKVSVIAVPAEESDYKIVVNAFYSPESLVAEFKKKDDIEINVSNFDFELGLESPEIISRGEEFGTKVIYKAGEEVEDLDKIKLKIDFPDNFETTGTDPEKNDDDFWSLEEDKEGEVLVNGRILLTEDDNFDIKANLTINILGEDHVFLTKSLNVSIEPSSLSFEITLAEHANVINPGERIVYAILYKNNTSVTLKNIVLRAELIGEMFDINSIESEGDFNSSNRKITWDSRDLEQLSELRPNESGQVTFSIKAKDAHPITRLNDKNFILVVDGEIESPTVPSSINTDKTFNNARLETKVAGLVRVDVDALFRDISAGVVNSGSFPPRVGKPTNYTIHWKVSNFGTDVGNVEVRARLEAGVTFVKVIKNNTDIDPEYNSATREVVWRLGDLLATTGVLSERPEVIFQIEAIPESSHKNKYMPLVEEVRVSSNDKFTETTISSIGSSVTTRLEGDNTVNEGDGRVVQ